MPHRIDAPSIPHPVTVRRQVPRRVQAALLLPLKEQQFTDHPTEKASDASDNGERDHWLRLHAVELISRLQAWADELEARERRLDARSAQQAHQESQLRRSQLTAESEIARQKESLERLRMQLRAHAQRMSFTND